MQTEGVSKRAETNGRQNIIEPIAVRLYAIKDGSAPKNGVYDYTNLQEVDKMPTYMATREVSKRLTVKAGNYIIIPSMFDKNKPMKFLLRVFTETNAPSANTNNTNTNNNQVAPVKPPVPAPAPNNNNNTNNNNNNNNANQNTTPVKPPVPIPAPIPNNNNNNNNNNAQLNISDNNSYDKWFYGGLNQNQIAAITKDAQAATAKLLAVKI